MKKSLFIILLVVTFIIEAALCFELYGKMSSVSMDNVVVNRLVKTIEASYGDDFVYDGELDYVLLDEEGKVLMRTEAGLSETVNEAVYNSDIMLDVRLPSSQKGMLIVRNTTSDRIQRVKNDIILTVIIISLTQIIIVVVYFAYIDKCVIRPFKDLRAFAARVAAGDLDIPINMDRKHIFGEFTEGFDIMRSELKRARAAEKKAYDDKKEMVAKLSHDIKTPIASIKTTSEIGSVLSENEKTRQYFDQINIKSDQITVLVDNLFNSSVNDITEIPVSPVERDSSILSSIIQNSDFLKKTNIPSIPACRIYVDKLRLQQVMDNIFTNSYKYADTEIECRAELSEDYLIISVRDFGPGVEEEEIPLLTEKYKRGSNTEGKEGAGLGLFLADYYMKNMEGKLALDKADPGLKLSVYIRRVKN